MCLYSFTYLFLFWNPVTFYLYIIHCVCVFKNFNFKTLRKVTDHHDNLSKCIGHNGLLSNDLIL